MIRTTLCASFTIAAAVSSGAASEATSRSQDVVQVTASAEAPGPRGPVRLTGALILPETKEVRAVIAVVRHGVGQNVFENPAWRAMANEHRIGWMRVSGLAASDVEGLSDAQRVQKNASLGGGAALIELLSVLATQTGRADLRETPVAIWGHSAAASFARTFAARYPARTAAFVSYQGNSRDITLDVQAMSRIPALIIAGAKDEQAGVEDSETLWKRGTAAAAPWTFLVQPNASHGSQEALARSHEFSIAWLRAVIDQRVASGGKLKAVDSGAGWRGNLRSFETSPAPGRPGNESVTWLPDEGSARAWAIIARQ